MAETREERNQKRRERYAAWRALHPVKHKIAVGVVAVTTALGIGTTVYTATPVPCGGGIVLGCATPTFGGGAGSDNVLPTATLTAPVTGSVLSGNTALTATAADNVAVAGVTFYVDNIKVGSEDTSSPYSVTVDTTAYGNGAHTIAAVSRDTSSNLSLPSSVNVTFQIVNTQISVTAADEWVFTTAGASPSRDCGGSVDCAYDSTKAYGSIGAAYAVAQPGDVIGVACATGAGTGTAVYPSQTLAYNATVDAGAQTVLIAPLDGCSPTVGAWTTLTNDYKGQAYYQSCNGGAAWTGFSDTCQAGHAGDHTVTVADTTNFSTSKTVTVDGNDYDALSCTGKTSTTFTGCGDGPALASNKQYAIRGGMGVPVWQDGTFDFAGASYVHVQGINAVDVELNSSNGHQGNYQTFSDAVVIATLGVTGTNNGTVKNVVIGPHQQGTVVPTLIATYSSGSTDYDATNLLFDNVTWNSGNANACADLNNGGCHSEAVFLRYVNGLTMQNSKFVKCEQYCIFSSSFATSTGSSRQNSHEAENVLIQNTYFGPNSCKHASNSDTVTIDYPCHNLNVSGGNYNIYLRDNTGKDYATCPQTACWTVRFDTFGENNQIATGATVTTASKMVVSSNYGRADWGCDAKLTYDHNVSTGTACTGTGNLGGQTFDVVNENAVDLHLNSGASAIAKGTTTSGAYPTTDRDGTLRGSNPDAGASQYAAGNAGSGGAGLSPGLSTLQSFSSHGTTRYYLIYKPQNLNDQCNGASGQHCSGVPLIVYSHGSSGSGCEIAGTNTFSKMVDCNLGTSAYSTGKSIGKTKWPAQCDAVGCIVVWPINYPAATCYYFNGSWGGGNANPCRASGIESNNAVFYGDLLDRIETSSTVGANIDTTKIYATGFSAGSIETALMMCSESTTAAGIYTFNTTNNPPASLNDFSGANSIASRFAGFATASSTWSEGWFTSPRNAAGPQVNSCTFPSSTKMLLISSKGDGTQPNDPARSATGVGCGNAGSPSITYTSGPPVVGNTCSIRDDKVEDAFKAQYSCGTETTSVISTPSYTSMNKHDLPSCTGLTFRWVSLGSATNNAPGHDELQYGNGLPAASNGEAGGEAQYTWDFWQGLN